MHSFLSFPKSCISNLSLTMLFCAQAFCCVATTHGAVTVVGDVQPADQPGVPGNQGLPAEGNTVTTVGVNAELNLVDVFGELLLDEDGNVVGQVNYERNVNVEVGRFSAGALVMEDGVALRYGDLIIGGAGWQQNGANDLGVLHGEFGQGSELASGAVRISGLGTVYNNHPRIVPAIYQAPTDPESTTFFIPSSYNPGPELGGVEGGEDRIENIARPGSLNAGGNSGSSEFDLYVGLTGSGQLEITDGGRVEIHDGAFVGGAPGSSGSIFVSGTSSYLGVYGMASPTTGEGFGAPTMIGLYGSGFLSVEDGGRVDSFSRVGLGSIGASDDISGEFAGGAGEALVEGTGSVWRVIGSGFQDAPLTIGHFFSAGDSISRFDNLLGNRSGYRPVDGRGKLTIRDGGLVQVQQHEFGGGESADVQIGRHGVLELSGGRINIDSDHRLDNDGIIRTETHSTVEDSGDGQIDTGYFLNSPLGAVRVGGGQSLRIRSHASSFEPQFVRAGNSPTTSFFYANGGQIDVIGDSKGRAVLELDRGETDTIDDPPNERSFQNLQFEEVPGADKNNNNRERGEVRGQITALDATLYFRSGLANAGDLLLVGGDILVGGDVKNLPTGVVAVANQTRVTFQDSLVSDGLLSVAEDSGASIFVAGEFEQTEGGELSLGLEGAEPDEPISIAGSANLDGSLHVEWDDAPGMQPGDTIELLTASGGLNNTQFAAAELPLLPDGLAMSLDYEADAVSLVVGLAGDYNQDGVVEAADYAVWLANLGGPAGTLPNAGDGGVIGLAHYATWKANYGASTSEFATLEKVAVPEPATWFMLVGAIVLRLCGRRSS